MVQIRPRKQHVRGTCLNAHCRNKTKSGYCATCRSRKSRLEDPVRYAYNNLKNRAKQRGKYFDLTLEQFSEFCTKTKYIQGKGRSASSFTVDRIDETQGYTADNLQILPLGQNIRKYLSYDWYTKTATVHESILNKKEMIDNAKNKKFLKSIGKATTTISNGRY